MRFHHLDLNLLVVLDTLLTEQNITRAASRLNVSQSAASGLLARLREYFDDELLVQVGRKMLPTPLAQGLAEPVRRVLLDIQSSIVNKPEFDPLTCKRHFKLIATDFVTTVILSPLAQRLQQRAPHISIDIQPAADNYNQMLTQGEVDFVIMPDLYLSDLHAKELLFEDDYQCVVWRDNPLVGETLSLEQYLQLGHVAVNFGNNREPSLGERTLLRYGKARRVELTTSSFNTVPHLLVGTHRIAVMHRSLATLYAGFLPLKILPLPFEFPSLREFTLWNKILDNDPAHRWMRYLLQEVAAQYFQSVTPVLGESRPV
ncbi:LysR family transcriptional regulator [Pseudomonas gingeri]|uniref:LysR family transcriptional regulator n=1 Tax=Pseudomonas gingeri TaxID=117681 RepID=UPI0015B990F2|nr:LysR family transcriptional regulator [Pseudomonas gingeri]NWE71830.1 LysR family transcriptional regulator [Pseudomonas gingeri]